MKKFLLAPAVAVVAGSMTLTGNVAFATTAPAPEAPKKTASAAASEDITVDFKDSYTREELDEEITVTVKGLEPEQKAKIVLSAKGENVDEDWEVADENGVAKVRVVVPDYDRAEPEYSITLFVDGDKVDFKGRRPSRLKTPALNTNLTKLTSQTKTSPPKTPPQFLTDTG